MIQAKKSLRKLSVGLSLAVFSFLFSEGAVWAGYKPPPSPTPTRVTGTTTGVRGGCTGDAGADLTAIAPVSHIGQSGSEYPSFVWFVPEPEPFPMEFRLYELNVEDGEVGESSVSPDAANKAIQRKKILTHIFDSQRGWMRFDLPQTEAPLSASKTYLWSVILHCNPNRPSRSQRIDAELKIRPPSTTLTSQLETLSKPSARADLLAQQGYWYDAIQLLTPTGTEEEIGPEAIATRADLLTTLAQIEPELRQSQLLEILQAAP